MYFEAIASVYELPTKVCFELMIETKEHREYYAIVRLEKCE